MLRLARRFARAHQTIHCRSTTNSVTTNPFLGMFRTSADGPPAQPKLAATAIICLPTEAAGNYSDYRILMIKRASKNRFMPGAHVFPGGVVEPFDSDARWQEMFPNATQLNLVSDPSKPEYFNRPLIRIAAIRELFEETCILLSRPWLGRDRRKELKQWREKVQKDASQFFEMCRSLGCKPDIDSLIPYANWITPELEKYRYDTFFYLSVLPPDAGFKVKHDEHETQGAEWLHPEDAIDAWTNGRISLPPPTWFTLSYELCSYRSHAALRSDVRQRAEKPGGLVPCMPHLILLEGEMMITLPGDADHPSTPPQSRQSTRTLRRILWNGGKFQLVTTEEELAKVLEENKKRSASAAKL